MLHTSDTWALLPHTHWAVPLRGICTFAHLLLSTFWTGLSEDLWKRENKLFFSFLIVLDDINVSILIYFYNWGRGGDFKQIKKKLFFIFYRYYYKHISALSWYYFFFTYHIIFTQNYQPASELHLYNQKGFILLAWQLCWLFLCVDRPSHANGANYFYHIKMVGRDLPRH